MFKIDDFLIRIIPEGLGSSGAGKGAGTAAASSGNTKKNTPDVMNKKVGGIFGGVLKGLGIASGIGIIVGIVSSMKGLLTIIGAFFKVIAALLRPIERVVMTLLMPILFILKPFIILVNQVMAPFIKLSMDMMRAGQQALKGGDNAKAGGLFAGAGAVALQGLSAVMVAVTAELMKMAVSNIFTALKAIVGFAINTAEVLMTPILSFFGMSADRITEVFDGLRTGANTALTDAEEFIKTGISTAGAWAVSGIAATSAFLAESMGIDTTNFRLQAKEMIRNTFVGAEGLDKAFEGIDGMAGFGIKAKESIEGVFGLDENSGMNGDFNKAMAGFGTKGSEAVKSAVSSINSEWGKLKKSGGSSDDSDNRGWFERTVDNTYGAAARVADKTFGT